MKTALILLFFLALLSCVEDAQQQIQPNNTGIKLELLFEHDGCKVYRFLDGTRYVYWSDCRGNMQTSHYQSSGKSGHTVYDYALNSGRK